MEIGYWLSSEEHAPKDLVANARRAEEAGFEHLVISDHIHPWVDAQGHSGFVWSTIGAIAQATDRIRLGTGVTCPLMRLHPAIVAHAAATAQSLMDGRFFLGVGTGENLNEHVLGYRWPRPDERLEMLEEAVDIIRALLGGEYETYRGKHYTVEQLKLYDAPAQPPQIIVAAAQSEAAKVAAEKGDGYMNTSPDAQIVREYEQAGGDGPRHGKVTGAFAPDRKTALEAAMKRFPNTALGGTLGQDLALPRDFEAATALVREEDLEDSFVLGNDLDEWRAKVDEFDRAGFTHVAVHSVTEDQSAFIDFARRLLD